MNIDFTRNMVCGEPGPNLYIKGKPSEFFELSLAIRTLSISNSIIIQMPAFVYENDGEIIFCSKKDGKSLRVEARSIKIELDKRLWKEVALQMFLISIEPGRVYLDFEDEEILDFDGNFIIDSN